jgi:hypothetical protein
MVGKVSIPPQPSLEIQVLAPRPAQSTQIGEIAGEVVGKPGPHFLTERIVRGVERGVGRGRLDGVHGTS